MKKRKTGVQIFLLLAILFLVSGCKRDNMEDIQIVTTNYPNEYIVSMLYQDHATIRGIYPDGVQVENYKITKNE